jgi:type I restriction enzyme S subunit
MKPVRRAEPPTPGKIYRQVGVQLWGRGAYERQPLNGGDTKYIVLSRVQTDDIIVNKIWARNGSVAVIPPSLTGCYVSGEFPTFEPTKNRLEPRWFHWFSKTPLLWDQCDEKSRGTSGQNRIRPEKFLEIKIPLPPLDEQRRIVSRIEELAAKIRAARELRGQAHKARHYLWQNLAEHFLNRPGQWPLRRLGDLVSLKGGGTPSKSNPAYWQGRVPWVSPKDMKARELYDSEDHISDEATTETSARLLNPNCVLIVVRGMILAHTVPAAILRVPAAINQDMKAMVPVTGILPEYICACIWAFNPRLLDLIEKSTHDTRKLETEKLLDFAIPVPPAQEQTYAVSKLNDLYCKVGIIEKLQSDAAVELDALMPSILSKAFRGEL